MTKYDRDLQRPDVRSGSMLMTWHGTFLMNDPRTDWIMHRRADGTAGENPLFVEVDGPAAGVGMPLVRRHTCPRALPSFAIAPDLNGCHTLRCVESGMAFATEGHLMCAIPDGTVEINRNTTSDWERFLLVDEDHYDWLTRLLQRGHIAAAGEQPLPVTVSPGPTLVSGVHQINLAAGLRAAAGSQPVQLTTTTGGSVSVILD